MSNREHLYDIICIGGGIMSSTLAMLLKILKPDLKIIILEKLDEPAKESTAALNNAGTGHSAFCELNYTPENESGEIDTEKAFKIFSQFERSKQFWAYLIEEGLISEPESFIRNIPHLSWVEGKQLVNFLRKRYEALSEHPFFEEMEFSSDTNELNDWLPLVMRERENSELAATRMKAGTEVNFEVLTEKLVKSLEANFKLETKYSTEVKDLERNKQSWNISAINKKNGEPVNFQSKRIFLGAGGGALPLLQKSEVRAHENYGGFPVNGAWLICKNEKLKQEHYAEAYTKAGVDAPPMAAPHLDTRFINDKRELIFGPFASFSTKFLNEGSWLDLPKSVQLNNIPAYWGSFWHNLDLVKYLMEQISMDHSDRMDQLREFIKDAKDEDWELSTAGMRVQVIKKDKEKGGDVEFGTDVVSNSDGTITALLGASPGASTAAHIMLEVMNRAFPEYLEEDEIKKKLEEIFPFLNKNPENNIDEFRTVQQSNADKLNLNHAY